ncbi:MAG: thioredoxin family protein [Planctomycetaceae bacterium]
MDAIETNFGTATARHPVVPLAEWTARRKKLLLQEKAFTRMRDRLSAERRELPWVKVEKNYVFDGSDGPESLADLFAGRSQLLIKHFMFGPGWKEGCVGCSFESDHLEAARVHLEHHDVTVVAVSRAPRSEFEPFQKRMGWRFKWVSSHGNDFNYDYHVSFTPEEVAAGRAYYNYAESEIPADELSGFSVFYKNDAGEIYHTYSTFGRGAEELMGTYVVLDMTPRGRNETGPNHNLTDWVRHHDCYEDGGFVDATGRYRPENRSGTCCGDKEARA